MKSIMQNVCEKLSWCVHAVKTDRNIQSAVILLVVYAVVFGAVLTWLDNNRSEEIDREVMRKVQILVWIQSDTEAAFAEGQRAYAEGHICIKKDSTGKYNWIKTPWDNGKMPMFNIDSTTSFKELKYNEYIPIHTDTGAYIQLEHMKRIADRL